MVGLRTASCVLTEPSSHQIGSVLGTCPVNGMLYFSTTEVQF
jgi:hypothetical protein